MNKKLNLSTEFFLKKHDHRQFFPKRPLEWSSKYKYYLNDNEIIMIRVPSTIVKLLVIVFFPLIYLFHGIANFKQLNKEMLDIIFSHFPESIWVRYNS